MKKYIIGFLALLFAGILVGCGDDKEKEIEESAAGEKVEITEAEKVDESDIVAVVNGDDIKGETYNLVYSQLKLHAGTFEEEVDNNEIKQATMESLIDRQLLLQQAKEEGVEVTDEVVDSEFETIKSENKEALDTLLEQYQITEEGFKDQLKFELTLNEFLAKTIEVTVTDEEVKEQYEKAKEGNDSIPEFDEIKDQLKKQLLQQKTDEALQAKIDKVKEKSEIEEKI